MTQVSRKGFVDKNGQKIVIVPPKEEYTGEDVFQNSEAIDAILTEGVHHISYNSDGKKYPTQHILVVTRGYGKTGPIAPTREIVHQLLIDDFGGMMKRYRKFTDTELLEPDGEWTEWTSVIPTIDIDSSITEDGYNPVTGAAVYDALKGKMNEPNDIIITYDGTYEILGNENAFNAAVLNARYFSKIVSVKIVNNTYVGILSTVFNQTNADTYDVIATLTIGNYVFTMEGQYDSGEFVWGNQGSFVVTKEEFIMS